MTEERTHKKEQALGEFAKEISGLLVKISENLDENSTLTRAERKFIKKGETAAGLSRRYNDSSFIIYYAGAIGKYINISNRRVDYISLVKENKRRARAEMDEILRSGLTPHEMFNGQRGDRNGAEERSDETLAPTY